MEILIFMLLVIIIFTILYTKSDLLSKTEELSQKVDLLRKELKTLKSKEPFEVSVKPEETIVRPAIPEKKEVHLPVSEAPLDVSEIKTPPVPDPVPAIVPVRPPVSKMKPVPPLKNPQPSFLKRNPDLEKFIGENLINKIGIAILVLGIGFFVKYAIDQEWINEIGRVFIGILCGGILLALAHKTRKNFKAFSSVLVGGGIAVFYFTIAIAFHQYHIFSQTTAFLLMLVITAFAVVLSIAYDRIELAVLAIIGGFASPLMVSTGEGNYIVLFLYILLLNVGMLVLAYFKKWNLINIICFVFTVILYGSWLGTRVVGVPEGPLAGALVFSTLFYIVFFFNEYHPQHPGKQKIYRSRNFYAPCKYLPVLFLRHAHSS
jgi:uncharacterized membrane protein